MRKARLFSLASPKCFLQRIWSLPRRGFAPRLVHGGFHRSSLPFRVLFFGDSSEGLGFFLLSFSPCTRGILAALLFCAFPRLLPPGYFVRVRPYPSFSFSDTGGRPSRVPRRGLCFFSSFLFFSPGTNTAFLLPGSVI